MNFAYVLSVTHTVQKQISVFCKGQEGQEVGIWEEMGAGWLGSPINKFGHAGNTRLHNTSCLPLINVVSARVRFRGRNKYGPDEHNRCHAILSDTAGRLGTQINVYRRMFPISYESPPNYFVVQCPDLFSLLDCWKLVPMQAFLKNGKQTLETF